MVQRLTVFGIILIFIPLFGVSSGGTTECDLLSWNDYLAKHSASLSSDWGRHILVREQSDIEVAEYSYGENRRTLSIFYPPVTDTPDLYPIVILVGNPDRSVIREEGKAYCYTAHALGWAQVFAEEGFAVVAFESEERPDKDVVDVVEWLRAKQPYGIDLDRIGLFSTSSACVYALKATRPDDGGIPYPSLVFSILAYGSLMNLQGMDRHVSYCLVSAEYDTAWTNQASVESFAKKMSEAGAEIVRLHHKTGNHGFEMSEYTEESKRIIEGIVEFMKTHTDK